MKKNCWYVFLIMFFLALSVNAAEVKPTNYKESDYRKDELDLSKLDEAQKILVMKILNHNSCRCGCTKGTLANCIKNDKGCSFSKMMGAKIAELIKEGKSEDFAVGFISGWNEATNKDKRRRPKEDPNKRYPVSVMNAPFKGPANAPVTIIEYTDYQCPFCQRVQQTLKNLFAEYPGKIRIATMNNPLGFHKNALPAAMAARAANKQGKFWAMHDLLYENARKLDDANLVKLAEKIGLNIEQFNKDRKDTVLEAEILKEQQQALKNNASGTPAFFINGKRISGAQPLAAFKEAVDEALKASKKGAE